MIPVSQNAILYLGSGPHGSTLNVTVFWNVTPCSLVQRCQRVAVLRKSSTLKKEIADNRNAVRNYATSCARNLQPQHNHMFGVIRGTQSV